jgi:disulfide bond formation protein DsbB
MRPRTLNLAVFLASAGLIGFGIYLQEVEQLEPCPLCILQRYAYVVVGLLALLAALLPRFLGRMVGSLGILSALTGAGIGVWHVWLQLHPPVVSDCGPRFEYLISKLPLTRALPRIFHGYGDCTQIDWTFLGLSIPAWSVICMICLAALQILAQRRA